jgi:CRP-like cAMP-binding protein
MRVLVRRDAKMELLSKVPLFERFSKRELTAVAALADELALPAGRVLTEQGARGREFMILVRGAAEVHQVGRLVNTLGPGDFFGEIALVSGSPRSATVTATTPVDVLVVTDRAFRDLMRRYPSMQDKVMEALAARLAPDQL